MLGTCSRYTTKPDCGFDRRAEELRNRPPAGRCEGRKPGERRILERMRDLRSPLQALPFESPIITGQAHWTTS